MRALEQGSPARAHASLVHLGAGAASHARATRANALPARLRVIGSVVGSVVVAVGLAVLAGIVVLQSRWAEARIGRAAVLYIESRFDATAELGSVSLTLFPHVVVTGRRLRLVRRDQRDGLPFLEARQFEVTGSPLALLHGRISGFEVDGVTLRVTRDATHESAWALRQQIHDVWIERVHLRHGRLLIVPNDPGALPLAFELLETTLRDFRFDRPSGFAARLTNPMPRMLIETEGHIGPWNTWALRSTPVSGTYRFADADLGTIRGLGGHLASTGSYAGTLGRMHVQGTTSSSDFQLRRVRHPVTLQTRFAATVDGTTGDTRLDEVDAVLGGSRILASGLVASTPGARGRTVSLHAQARAARLEDLVGVAVRQTSPMHAQVDLETTLDLPPGDAEVPDRVALAGTFAIRGRFADEHVQARVDELSRRGQGRPRALVIARVVSTLEGRFALGGGVLRLPRLRFAVGGARVDARGDYRLGTEVVRFIGALTLDVPLSHTVTGFKAFLLKAADPLVRHGNAKTRLPITVGGTLHEPEFGVDLRRLLLRRW